MMSKIVLFVCLVLGTVYANTQIRVVNAQYDASGTTSPGLTANLNDYVNITNLQSDLYGTSDSNLIIPASDYQPLPIYSFVIGEPLTISVFDLVEFPSPPITAEASVENITLVENQSYSFVYIAKSNEESFFSSSKDVPTMLLPFEERPDPSPFGKALLRIVNIAVATYEAVLVVNVTGTGVAQVVTVPFGAASEFLEFDSAIALTLEFTTMVDDGLLQRSLSVTTVINSTQVVYIRGDIGDIIRLGSLTETVAFAFPAAPTPVAPPTAEPVSEPMADAPTAPTAAPTTVPAARTPTKRVSSAAQNVAQVAGVAALVSLLF